MTPSRNRSHSNSVVAGGSINQKQFFSPAPQRNSIGGAKDPLLTQRHGGANSVIREAKIVRLQPNITGEQLRNQTALELSRFIDKRLTDFSRHNVNHAKKGGDETELMGMADDQNGRRLRARLYNNAGRKEIITNKTNFRDIENPFADYSLTLQTIKKEKHEAWKQRKAEKSLKLKQ